MVKVISLKLNSESEWDRAILDWLGRIPSGQRSAMIKYFLWRAITGKSLEGPPPGPEDRPSRKTEISERLSRKLDSLRF